MGTSKRARRVDQSGPGLPVAEEEAMSKDLTQYVTTEKAAELLGVSSNHVRLLLGRGKLMGTKLGHEWIVYVPSVAKYQEAKSPQGRPPSRRQQAQSK